MKKLFQQFFYAGSIEALISDLDDLDESYGLIIDLINGTYYYEPDEIDLVEPKLLGYKVNFYTVKHTDKGMLITVNAEPYRDPWAD